MNAAEDAQPHFYIDIRYVTAPSAISLDLSRHLPRRAMVGPVAILTNNPTVLLSVIKKRWAKIIHEVERQYSSTLDHRKKEGLRRELERLHGFSFAAAFSLKAAAANPDILFVNPEQLTAYENFMTIYLTLPLPHKELARLTTFVQPGGLLVLYHDDRENNDTLLRQLRVY